MNWDVFISHASEDKAEVARPLGQRLTTSGLSVWLDETALRLGDSLREKIDQGLAGSGFGILIVSESFFAKKWPRQELDGLVALETAAEKRILPVWHNVDQQRVAAFSPILASRLAISTSVGLDAVANKISEDIFFHRGKGIFDAYHASDREWLATVQDVFTRSAWRGRYHGYTGQERYVEVIKQTIKTLNIGSPAGAGAIAKLTDHKLHAMMMSITDRLKRIDNLIETHPGYPGQYPGVVEEINAIRDAVISDLNRIWSVFRLHTLPLPSSIETTMSVYDEKGGAAPL
jgi:hypothetical protein